MSEETQLTYLQPAQYASWLRKADDPEWDDEDYPRSKTERAMVSAVREIRDLHAALQNIVKRFEDADDGTLQVRDGVAWAMASDARAALRGNYFPQESSKFNTVVENQAGLLEEKH